MLAVPDRDRRDLYEGLRQQLGEARADTLMALLPPSGWADVARTGDLDAVRTELKGDIRSLRTELKGDINALRAELKGDIAELKGDINALRAELKGDIAELKGDMAQLRGEVKGEIAELRAALKTQLPRIVAANVATIVASSGLVFSIARAV